MEKSVVCCTSVDKVTQAKLPDMAHSLEDGRVHNILDDIGETHEPVDRAMGGKLLRAMAFRRALHAVWVGSA
jgi:hypothetical protein